MRWNDNPPASLSDDGRRPLRDADDFDARVAAICAQVETLDTEISALEHAVAPLPDVLRLLGGHPVLWLLIGREGIDRPGALGTIVGQQVVTLVRRDRAALIVVGLVMLLIGVGIGVGGYLLFHGGI
jgi:hypothetical protein